MSPGSKTSAVLFGLSTIFVALAAGFLLDFRGQPALLYPIPLVATNFLDTATVRRSYADLVRAGDDLSDFDCYACHERGKPPRLRFDADQHLIVPKEHSDVVMGHGRHGRNNNCFNCHDENNLELLETRDGHQVKFADSPALCGSCHGPTYRDWEAGAHGRISGYWDRDLGEAQRKACVNCHNPHSPRFPSRQPAPGPHLLRPVAAGAASSGTPSNPGSEWVSLVGRDSWRAAVETKLGVLAREDARPTGAVVKLAQYPSR